MGNLHSENWQPRSPEEMKALLVDPRLSYVQPLCKEPGKAAGPDDYRVIVNNGPVLGVTEAQYSQLSRLLRVFDNMGGISSVDVAPPRPKGIDG